MGAHFAVFAALLAALLDIASGACPTDSSMTVSRVGSVLHVIRQFRGLYVYVPAGRPLPHPFWYSSRSAQLRLTDVPDRDLYVLGFGCHFDRREFRFSLTVRVVGAFPTPPSRAPPRPAFTSTATSTPTSASASTSTSTSASTSTSTSASTSTSTSASTSKSASASVSTLRPTSVPAPATATTRRQSASHATPTPRPAPTSSPADGDGVPLAVHSGPGNDQLFLVGVAIGGALLTALIVLRYKFATVRRWFRNRKQYDLTASAACYPHLEHSGVLRDVRPSAEARYPHLEHRGVLQDVRPSAEARYPHLEHRGVLRDVKPSAEARYPHLEHRGVLRDVKPSAEARYPHLEHRCAVRDVKSGGEAKGRAGMALPPPPYAACDDRPPSYDSVVSGEPGAEDPAAPRRPRKPRGKRKVRQGNEFEQQPGGDEPGVRRDRLRAGDTEGGACRPRLRSEDRTGADRAVGRPRIRRPSRDPGVLSDGDVAIELPGPTYRADGVANEEHWRHGAHRTRGAESPEAVRSPGVAGRRRRRRPSRDPGVLSDGDVAIEFTGPAYRADGAASGRFIVVANADFSEA